jgi:putative heme-binding domain-containing protein
MEMRKAGVFSGPIEGGGSPVGYFTGACGLFMPRPGAWPAADRQDGFLAEGSSNLVHRMRLRPNGVPYAAYRVEEKRDFLTSDECWFRPVQFCGGPDGNLYVVDLYRECYEHPDAVPPSVKKHMDLSTGKDRGRIYRVVPEGFRRGPLLLPGKLSTAHLVGLLAHPNGWHRETASRLLYERQDRSAVGPLEKLAVGPDPLGRLHAMYALDGLNALSAEVVLARLADPHPRVREHAVRLAERVLDKSPKVREALCTMAGDKDIRVRYQLAFTLGEFPGPASTAALVKIAAQDPDDRWIGLAVFSSCFGRSGDLLGRLTEDRTWRTRDEARSLLERLAEQVGLEDREPQVGVVLRVLAGIGHDEDRLAQALVRGLSHGLAQSGSPLRQKLARDSARAARILVEIIEHAKQTARQEDRNLASRIEAVHAMALAPFADVRDTLRELLTGRSPQELQMAVLQMLRRFSEPESAKMITAAWPGFSPAVRSEAAEVLFGRKAWLPVLLEAVENKTILAGQIDPARLQVLLTHPEPAIRKKAESLLANDKLGRRQDVIAAHRDVLKMKGDAARGKAVFKRECATCHRLEDVGFELGLPLTSVQNKGREFMLLNILDPNLQVLPEYVNYVALTTEGRSVTGMIVSETASSITLRRAEGQSDTVLRTNLEELQSTGLSIMPEGLETKLSKQDLADVIEYLMSIK